MMISKHFNHVNRRKVNGPSAAVIRYDEATGEEPTIVAQGKGYVAEKIMAMAKENNIHVEEDTLLLENLLDMDLGENIPPQLYAVIAEILLLIEEMERSY
ncbi:EscU/YscU/HrcU family type III secretion system export apparatus switch protein [Salipaludibacillus agaradhaerens]|uniref:EscU/YscU/HrcU family type III secretion system export apparatus switch protein n=1 Tax=Salipaludibacillus agaradhaerens TaxID=76935 RepID=A0A9Q4FYR9_SALAG|nr:EscU/YscU/HrcU family type III secretion system export apparatus switch protein [Salipaludibacillus agaradhaerens]UJW57595.1 EscU/YscU/HrcU family type III secretion system export apparatus switch protein [Bacillus sp. A116_S68]MCR6096631.1 EscU/YscU/HrcU family type III secretion system export apparatus switch protein [Salipaludibacillus agaradhaerens]MCR6106463.1 EscU/YscU/HrcU family type III secretion system export apparatus switch protein [Salipaludibacillus agaradhaerens]MCR6113810.1 E